MSAAGPLDAVATANQDRLRDVIGEQPEWADRFGQIEQMSALEAELWYWRYATEIIHTAGNDNRNYVAVVYEQLAAEPIPVLQACFAKCGLAWSPEIEQAAAVACRHSRQIADRWRERLAPELCERIAEVLADSPMNAWWRTPAPA